MYEKGEKSPKLSILDLETFRNIIFPPKRANVAQGHILTHEFFYPGTS